MSYTTLSGNDKEKKLASLGRITSASGHKPDPKTIKSTIMNPPRRYSLVARQDSDPALMPQKSSPTDPRSPDMPGLYEKYRVARTDGRPVGECFVLETDDPATAPAMLAYAAATDKAKFAADLRERFTEPEPGADIPDEVVEAAMRACVYGPADGEGAMRAALAAADAKRAELEEQA